MYTLKSFFTSRTGIVVAVLVVLAAIAGTVFFFLSSSSSAEVKAGEVPEGMISIEQAPALPPADQARPAQPAPEEPVAEVFLEGECLSAAEMLRTVMDEYPSGLALDEPGIERLNEGLTALSTDCSMEETTAFQAQELLPWMNYAVATN